MAGPPRAPACRHSPVAAFRWTRSSETVSRSHTRSLQLLCLGLLDAERYAVGAPSCQFRLDSRPLTLQRGVGPFSNSQPTAIRTSDAGFASSCHAPFWPDCSLIHSTTPSVAAGSAEF